jgi:DNA-directed RNA polymerase specialized sigma24 family protein
VLGRPGAVRAARPDGPLPRISEYPSDEAEAHGVGARAAIGAGPDRPWSRLAVLYRINAQSAVFEEALTRAGVPFRVRGGERFLDRPEVQVALDTLRKRRRPRPGRAFAPISPILTVDAEMSEERREHIDALARLGREYLDAEGGQGSVDGFLAFLNTSLRGDDADAVGSDAVELLTFHRAKGLEFDTVFVTGLERGLVPISARQDARRARRRGAPLYVALSRAERMLHLSWAQTAAMGMRTAKRSPSPYLGKVDRALAVLSGREDPGARSTARTSPTPAIASRRRAAPPKSKRERLAVAEADAPLLDALMEWRLKLSRRRTCRPIVIFNNNTLVEIATDRPRTRSSCSGSRAWPGEGRAVRRRRARVGARALRASPPRNASTWLTGVAARVTIGRAFEGETRRCEMPAIWRSTLPLFPTDDGWPYPDTAGHGRARGRRPIDLDQLELRVDPHAFSDLTEWERFAVVHRYGINCPECSMKELAQQMECSHAEARELLGSALDKLRQRLTAP